MENKLFIKAELQPTKEKKTPKIHGLAYAGGKIGVGFQYDVVIDLQGMQISQNLPLLQDHSNKMQDRLGNITATIRDNQLFVDGEIVATTDSAKNIVEQGKKSVLQLSIGAQIVQATAVEVGEMTVNNQVITAPFIYVAKSTLRQVSIVAVGADKYTQCYIEAKAKLNSTGDKIMEEKEQQVVETVEQTVQVVQETAEAVEEKEAVEEITEEKEIQAVEETQVIEEQPVVETAEVVEEAEKDNSEEIAKAIADERKRVQDIQAVVNGEDSELEKEAIKAGWTADFTASKMLNKIRANRPNLNLNVKGINTMDNKKAIEAALSLRAGIKEDVLVKTLGEQAVQAGYNQRNNSLKDFATDLLKAQGKTVNGFGNRQISAAFGATDLTGILSNVANKRLQQSFATYEPVALKVAQEADINDFKKSEVYSIADADGLTEVDYDNAKLADGKLAEVKGENEIKTYGKIIRLTRKDIINDDLGAFTRMIDILGKTAARTIDKVFFSKVLANGNFTDGKAFFGEQHNNIMTGADTALSIEAVKNAIAKFITQVGVDGEPIAVMPKYLMVPSELYMYAKEIAQSQYVTGGNARNPQLNSVAGLLEVVQSPYLSNATYEGNSKTAWYVMGGKDELPAFEVGFLKGQRTPVIQEGQINFDQLSVGFRCYYDFGVGMIDPKGAVKVTGIA